jgi:hypothetical protein
MKLFWYWCMGGCGCEQAWRGYRHFGVRLYCPACRRERLFVDPMPAPRNEPEP